MKVSRQMKTVPQQHTKSTVSASQKTDTLSEEGQHTPKSRLSFWHYLREVLEATLALGIVSIIGTFFPSIWFQSHLLFCVFFLIVFVIAIRSHVVTTYTVGFLVAGCYSFLLWQQANSSFVMPQIFLEPFLLFVSGIVISETLHAIQHQLEVARQQHVQKEAFLEEMKQRYQDTQALNVELERQLIEQAFSVITVSEKIARLCGLQGEDRYNAILDIVIRALNAKFCALYMLRNGHMSLCASQKSENSQYTHSVRLKLDVNDVLISRTIQTRQVCTIRDILADSRPTRQAVAIMAGPIVDHCNEIVGIVIVDDIPLLKFFPTTVRLFGSLLQMLSMTVHTGMPVTDAAVPDISFPFLPDAKEMQTAILATNRDTVEDNCVTQLPGLLRLPRIQELQGGRRLRFFAQK